MSGPVLEAQNLARRGDADGAERVLRSAPDSLDVRMALAQLLASLGRRDQAIVELQRAVASHPAARDARLMLARLANELGSFSLSEEQSRWLTERDPRDSEAWSALGFALFSQGQPRQARAALERAVELTPGYAVAHRNLAAVHVDQERSEAALEAVRRAKRHGAAPAVADRIAARALIQLDRLEEAESLLRGLLGQQPSDAQALRLLAQLRHLRGDADPLVEMRAAALAADAPPTLRMTYADLLRRRGELEQAEAELLRMNSLLGPVPELLAALATVRQERGDWSAALESARTALAGNRESLVVAESYVVSCIGAGVPAEALPVVEALRHRRPRDQRWITHRMDIARLRGESGFEAWYSPELVTQTFELPDDRFLAELRTLLENKHRHRAHPLEQSIRRGTQTSRNLLVDPEAPLQRLFAWFDDCLRRFVQRLAAELPAAEQAAHPVLARAQSAPRPVGCWSVRLTRGGFHVNHIHPEGWLSSAFYVQVPEEADDVSTKSGWLKFGEPAQAASILTPLAYRQPKPGRLVLFPSYLWHGTTPLQRDCPRLTVAFDAVPEAELL